MISEDKILRLMKELQEIHEEVKRPPKKHPRDRGRYHKVESQDPVKRARLLAMAERKKSEMDIYIDGLTKVTTPAFISIFEAIIKSTKRDIKDIESVL